MNIRWILILLIFIVACKSHRKVSQTVTENKDTTSFFKPKFFPPFPPILVYKTKGDYSNLVPVLLSQDKSKIISYPDISDLDGLNGERTPLKLNQNYLMDQKGISKDVAFLKLTYKEYKQLEHVPSLQYLDSMILDRDPLIELCDCGNKSSLVNPYLQLNPLIDSAVLRKICRVIK